MNFLLPFTASFTHVSVYQYVMLVITLLVLSAVTMVPEGVEIVLGRPRSEPPATDPGR